MKVLKQISKLNKEIKVKSLPYKNCITETKITLIMILCVVLLFLLGWLVLIKIHIKKDNSSNTNIEGISGEVYMQESVGEWLSYFGEGNFTECNIFVSEPKEGTPDYLNRFIYERALKTASDDIISMKVTERHNHDYTIEIKAYKTCYAEPIGVNDLVGKLNKLNKEYIDNSMDIGTYRDKYFEILDLAYKQSMIRNINSTMGKVTLRVSASGTVLNTKSFIKDVMTLTGVDESTQQFEEFYNTHIEEVMTIEK